MKTKITGIMLLFALFAFKANSQVLTINSVNITNATGCSVCNGFAVANVTGGHTPYTYYWVGGGSNNHHRNKDSNLCAATYYLFVFDAWGDTAINSGWNNPITIGPSTIFDSLTATATTCGNNTGTAYTTVIGGTTPYTYSWSPGGATTALITGLSSGTYTCVVTSASGCNYTDSVYVAMGGLQVTPGETDVLCHGSSTGSATVTSVTGGASPYTYLWSDANSQTTATASNLSAGLYNVTVTNSNGCAGTASIFVDQPTALSVDSGFAWGTTCTGNGGSVQAQGSGGISPYTYSWSPGGQTTETVTGLSAGTYTVTVYDANGCSAMEFLTVQASGPLVTTSVTSPTCNGSSDGSATITNVTGGVSPFTYAWLPSNNQSATITGLSAGNYNVAVTDNTGCSGTTVVSVSQPAPIQLSHYVFQDSLNTGVCNNTIVEGVSGGTGPYTFSWSQNVNIVSQIDSGSNAEEVIDSVCSGSYTVCVTDAHGCSSCDNIGVPVATGIASIKENNNSIRVYPNPVSDNLFIATDGLEAGRYTAFVYDMMGRQIQAANVTVNPGETVSINVAGIAKGEYMLRVSGANSNRTAPFIINH